MFRPVRKKANEISVEEAKSSCTRLAAACWPSAETTATPTRCPSTTCTTRTRRRSFSTAPRSGHKVDALKRSDKVCFTVYGRRDRRNGTRPGPRFLKSAVVFGRCRLVADRGESDALCKKFAMKYYPTEKMVDDEVAASGKAVQMFRISIDHISGKKVQER